MANSDDRERSRNRSGQETKSFIPSVQVIGWAFVLLILAGYFAWMIVEMGAHAVPKAWPMVGVIVAAIAGAIAASLGLVLGRRGRD
jgi:hypothetical protein